MRAYLGIRHLPLILLLGGWGCADAGDPLSIAATGALEARAFLDVNGNGSLDPQVDLPAAGLALALLQLSGDTVVTELTDAGGVAHFTSIPVGSYEVHVGDEALGDSLRVISQGSSDNVTVAAGSTPVVSVTLGYPVATSADVQNLPLGRVVMVEGVALHPSNVFGDSLLHIRDATGVIRIRALPPRIAALAGDSLSATGRVGIVAGRPALLEATTFVFASSPPPAPVVVSAAEARSARGAQLDGALVQVNDTQVLSGVNLPTGDLRLRVSDASGPLEVVFDHDTDLVTEESILPGVLLDVTGILIPADRPGEWVLKPRSGNDLEVTVPRVSIAEARTVAPGTLVSFDAIALNGLATFGDNSVHFADPTGTIRAVGVTSSFLFAGDSVAVEGIITIRQGQPVLTPVEATVLGKSTAPPPLPINTDVARSADGGRLDAALVEVGNATVQARASSGGNVFLQVNDGSGLVVVLIDPDTGIGAGGILPGTRLDLIGLLVPTGSGEWLLMPRSPADLVVE